MAALTFPISLLPEDVMQSPFVLQWLQNYEVAKNGGDLSQLAPFIERYPYYCYMKAPGRTWVGDFSRIDNDSCILLCCVLYCTYSTGDPSTVG